MKKIYLMFFFISGVWSLQAQYDDPYQFFPANIGDYWEYTQAGPDITYTVLRDSIDQKDSSRIVFYNIKSYLPEPTIRALYRIDKHYNVFLYSRESGSSVLQYKLDAKKDESWIFIPMVYAKKVMDVYQAYVFGKWTTIKKIGHYSITGDTVLTQYSRLLHWDILAYGFGLISQEDGATQPMLLRGCRINGVVYGTVDVKDNLTSLPSEFILHQNYPNPFNPSTVIIYQLPKISHVILRVFDILGREIATPVNEEKPAGKYEVKFDGSGLASGIYFYQLITNRTSSTMKMILQK